MKCPECNRKMTVVVPPQKAQSGFLDTFYYCKKCDDYVLESKYPPEGSPPSSHINPLKENKPPNGR